MIHLFRLIALNISSSTNSDKIKIAKENRLRDSSETKLVFFGIIGLTISYLVYWITTNFLIPLKYNVLILSFVIASLLILISNISNIKEVLIYKTEDDYLFSLPLTSSEIIISKLFITYIKNLIYIFIIMFPSYYAIKEHIKISETSSLIYLLTGITLPLIPLILGTIYAFVDSYYNQGKKKKKYNIVRILIILLIIGIFYFLFRNVNTKNINNVITRLSFINPFIYLFKLSIINNNLITTLLLIFLPVILFYLFIKSISVNYNYILSKIRGVKLSKNMKVIPAKPKNQLKSIIHKELLTIFNNKTYFRSSIYLAIMMMLLFLIMSIVIDTKEVSNIHDFGIFLMLFLSFIGAISCTTINSLSLEKNNIIYFKSLPIKFSKLLFGKFLVNILTNIPIIIINLIITAIFYKVSKLTLLASFINPLLLTILISLLGLILDFRFINYKEKDSDSIIKNRLITYIPILANILIISVIFFINPADQYNLILFIFSGVNIFFIILFIFYLLISYKKILNTNIK